MLNVQTTIPSLIKDFPSYNLKHINLLNIFHSLIRNILIFLDVVVAVVFLVLFKKQTHLTLKIFSFERCNNFFFKSIFLCSSNGGIFNMYGFCCCCFILTTKNVTLCTMYMCFKKRMKK